MFVKIILDKHILFVKKHKNICKPIKTVDDMGLGQAIILFDINEIS